MFRHFTARTSDTARRLAEDIELLHNSPLVDPVWYRETYPDLRDTPIDVARHYLQYGAREGRNPSPLFDTKFYLEQNPDVTASGANPLVHYITRGQKDGRQPLPSIPSASQTSTAQDCCQEAITASPEALNAFAKIPEPGIKPPPLIASTLAPGAICSRNAQIVAAIRQLKAKNIPPGTLVGRQPAPNDMGLSAVKIALIGTDEGLSGASLSAGTREALEQYHELSVEDVLAGLGITPNKTIMEQNIPHYEVPILRRYNEGRLEASRRFELSPPRGGTINSGPTISILTPVYRLPIVFLERAILSVVFQTYANWELILVDDFSQRSDIEGILNFYASVDPRIKVHFRPSNGGISAASNDALHLASGEYIGLLDHDDMLTCDALEKVAERLVGGNSIDFVYSDECTIDRDNVADDLFHKPDWSPLLLLNFMYTGHFSVYRKSLVKSVGGFRSKYDLSQDYDLVLRIAERQPQIAHIDEILYGWRMIPGSGARGDRPDARVTNVGALQDAADRRGYDGIAIPLPTANRVKRTLKGVRPLVSIVIPSDNYSNILDSVNSIKSHSTYENYEILVVTNSEFIAAYASVLRSSTTRVIIYDEPFNFSKKCNVGAASAKGEYVVFFNDDVRVISPDWIESLLEYLTLPGVGAVSPKLLYENGSIQHAGMVTGVRRLVGTAFHAYPADTTAYANLAQSVRECSVLSGACLSMSSALFRDVGGFDSINAPIGHSDIDLCFRIRERGLSCVYSPHAQLTHVGHVSIAATELAEEKKAKPFRKSNKVDLFLLKKWGRCLHRDPYFPLKMRNLVYIDSQELFQYFPAPHGSDPTGSDVLIFSHDLSLSGAPKCVLNIARVLIEEGCFVVVMSPEDGTYRDRLLEIGAHVIIDPLALIAHESVLDFAKNFDVAICNTILCWPNIKPLTPFLPVYLYCHEGELVRHLVDSASGFREGLARATKVWAAGPLAAARIRDYCGVDPAVLEPGIEEFPYSADRKEDQGVTVIALLGTYEPRKGQDLAVQGFNLLSPEKQQRLRLIMAGRTNDSPFRNAIEVLAQGNPNIVFRGVLDNDSAIKHLSQSDIVIVPSRDDPGPAVAIEALSAAKILIVSVTSGVSEHIIDGESGFILRENSPADISATINRVLERSADWPRIGANARKVYEATFTPRQFKVNLLRELNFRSLTTFSDTLEDC